MNDEKYIGLDVHQATISVAVMDSTGKVVMESILETKAATILEFLAGLRGTLSVTFEEGTWSVWLYDLLNPRVDKLVVCNPRKNALLVHEILVSSDNITIRHSIPLPTSSPDPNHGVRPSHEPPEPHSGPNYLLRSHGQHTCDNVSKSGLPSISTSRRPSSHLHLPPRLNIRLAPSCRP